MSMFRGAGLSLDQAPPLAIPMSFFLMAPVALLFAGGLLVVRAEELFLSNWAPATIALTHLGTLGFLLAVMLGAMFQMTPVLGGAAVGRVRLAYGLLAIIVIGVVGLVGGLLWSTTELVSVAISALLVGVAVPLVMLLRALSRASVVNDTVKGMKVALWALAAVTIMGVWMAHGFAGMRFPGPRPTWLQVHLTLGLLGWVGGLIMAVSWQLIPMFYLTPGFGKELKRWCHRGLVLGIVATGCVPLLQWLDLLGGIPATRVATIFSAPAAVVIWWVHTVSALAELRRRRRKKVDPSKEFWIMGLCTGLLLPVVGLTAHLSAEPAWGLTFGWLAIWGWAGGIIHGMLTRIVPFLVWFHRFSPFIGHAPVPAIRKMLPAAMAKRGLALHLLSLLFGLVAIWVGGSLVVRVAGCLLFITGLHILTSLTHVLRQFPDSNWHIPPSSNRAA